MRGQRRADLAVTAALTLVVLGPLLTGPGYWLVGDMVFVPHQPWKGAWLGLDGALPRAVPMDAIVSLLTQVVPGSVVQRVFLVGAFVLGGLGVGRLVRDRHVAARAAAIVLYLWNPWVHDHLQLGQWAILAGYLALPWVALAARRLRDDPRAGWAPAAVALVLSAVCSPSSGVMAVVVLAVLGLRRSRRSIATVAGLAVVANLPWLVPSLVARTAEVSTDGVFTGFAARAESGLGTVASLLSLGGTWKTAVVAPERTLELYVVLAALLSVVALLGLRRHSDVGEARRLLALAALSLLVAVLPAVAAGADLMGRLGDDVPGLALLRDSHRFLAPAALALAVGAAGAVGWLRDRIVPGREALWVPVVALVVAPIVLLPSLAWGAHDIRRSTYPDDFAVAADLIGAQPAATTVVLPWEGSYRRFPWAHERAVLDPAPRYLPGDVLVDDRTFLDDTTVPAEAPRVDAVRRALDVAGGPAAVAGALRDLGVRWVVVEHDQPGDPEVPAGDVVLAGATLDLVDLGTPPGVSGMVIEASDDYAAVVIAGHLCALLLLIWAGVWILRGGSNGRHTR